MSVVDLALVEDDDRGFAPPAMPMSIISAEIDVQIATAKRYPRALDAFMKRLMADVTVSEDVAAQCFYKLERKNKDGSINDIFGPSIRFAEILLARWGNARAAARIVDVGEQFVVAQGAFHDLETNAAISKETQRSIMTAKGKRYGADMIMVTGNACASIALRNAILAGVPQAYWRGAYIASMRTAVGKAETFGAKVKRALEFFAAQGVDAPRVFAALSVSGIADIGADQILALVGLKTAIEVEGKSVDDLFPPVAGLAPPKSAPPAAKANPNPDGAASTKVVDAANPAQPGGGSLSPVPQTQGPKTAAVAPSGTPSGDATPPRAGSAPPAAEAAPDAFHFRNVKDAREWAADHRARLEACTSGAQIKDLRDREKLFLAALHEADEELSNQIYAVAFELGEALG